MPWIVTKEESNPESRGPSIKRWSQSCLELDSNSVRYDKRDFPLPEKSPLGGTFPPIPLSTARYLDIRNYLLERVKVFHEGATTDAKIS